jgi:hypothetical protein
MAHTSDKCVLPGPHPKKQRFLAGTQADYFFLAAFSDFLKVNPWPEAANKHSPGFTLGLEFGHF